jgi:hypothetical protein
MEEWILEMNDLKINFTWRWQYQHEVISEWYRLGTIKRKCPGQILRHSGNTGTALRNYQFSTNSFWKGCPLIDTVLLNPIICIRKHTTHRHTNTYHCCHHLRGKEWQSPKEEKNVIYKRLDYEMAIILLNYVVIF